MGHTHRKDHCCRVGVDDARKRGPTQNPLPPSQVPEEEHGCTCRLGSVRKVAEDGGSMNLPPPPGGGNPGW